MHIFVISLIGVVVTFAPLGLMVLAEKRVRPQEQLWRTLSITVFVGVAMVVIGLFAAGLVTTPTAPPSAFWRW